MRTSQSTQKISAALAKAQEVMENPDFDSKNPFFGNDYASLAGVRNAVVPVLARHGIGFSQSNTALELLPNDLFKVCITTRLLFDDEWIESDQWLVSPTTEVKQNGKVRSLLTPQGIGGVNTYARRYGMQAAGGVVGEPDDDGNAASVGHAPAPPADPLVELREILTQPDFPVPTGASAEDARLAWVSYYIEAYVGAWETLSRDQARKVLPMARDGRAPKDFPKVVSEWVSRGVK